MSHWQSWFFFLLTLPLTYANAANVTVFAHGQIHLLDAKNAVVSWLAVSEGKVIASGTGEVDSSYAKAPQVDLANAVVYPGLTDSHAHLSDIGETLFEPDLKGA